MFLLRYEASVQIKNAFFGGYLISPDGKIQKVTLSKKRQSDTGNF
jgi:hypothetical protein